MMKSLCALPCALCLLLAPGAARSEGQLEDDLNSINSLLKTGKIAEVTVWRMSDEIMTAVGVGPEYLKANGEYVMIFRGGKVRAFETLMVGISTVAEKNRVPDLRWGVAFYDYHHKEVGSIFVDRFSEHGYIGSQSVVFKSARSDDNLVARLRRILATIK